MTPRTEAYFTNNVSPVPEPQPELASDKLLRMKISQTELRNLCSRDSLNIALSMNSHGELFMVEDSFVQKDKTLSWKVKSESLVNPNIPVHSKSKTREYPVTIRYNEVMFYFVFFLFYYLIREMCLLFPIFKPTLLHYFSFK